MLKTLSYTRLLCLALFLALPAGAFAQDSINVPTTYHAYGGAWSAYAFVIGASFLRRRIRSYTSTGTLE